MPKNVSLTQATIPEDARKEFQEYGFDCQIGSQYLRKRSYNNTFDVVLITGVEYTKKYGTWILYRDNIDIECTQWNPEEQRDKLDRDTPKELTLLDRPFSEWRKESLDLIEGKINIDKYKEFPDINEEHALVAYASKEMLTSMEEGLQKKADHLAMVKKFVGYEMERRKAELEKIREQLGGVLAIFHKQIEKVQRIITSIELYLGIHEELHQIKTGALAPQKDPICFRQAVLYMDEEMGVWEGGGLDYTHIEWFDEWLVEKDRFKGLIPESKGVVVFRPRRFSKRYDKDELKNAIKNAPNLNSTYLLIRNGDNLYRIFTDNIVILPRLFPKRDELSKILEGMSHELEMWEKYQDERSRQEIQDRVDDEMYQYRKRAILLQGLIDRTDVFLPLPAEKVSMFKMDETPDAIRFIYDDEMQLPTGRLPFWEWHKEVNLKIKHGSRVLFTGNYYKDGYRSHSDFRDRIYYFVNEFNAPAPPAQAVYVVEKYKQPHREWKKKEELEELKAEGIEYVIEDENPNKFGEYDDKKKRYIYNIPGYRVSWFVEHLTIMHNPGGKTRHGWSDWEDHDRVKRIRFRIYPEDKWLINYDQISLDDIEFYLTSRVDRPKYLYMMPVLEKIKIERVKELEQEEYFIQFVIGRNAKIESIEKRVREAVNWWKYKNQWKRPIAKDDTLALRMIEKRVQSKNYDSFEHFDKL